MKLHGLSAVLGASAIVLALAACSGPVPDPNEARSAVEAFLEDYNAAFAAADTSRIRALYVEDDRLAWLEDGVVKYRSVGDILASLRALPPGSRAETQLTDPQIHILDPGHATVTAEFSTQFTSADQGGFAFNGAISMVLERADGSWRVVSGHTSTARPAWESPSS